MKKEYQQLPSYPLRLEPETRAKLEAIAKANGRSLHAEISMRLDASLLGEETAPATESPYVTVDEMKAMMKDNFKQLYDTLIKSGLKPVAPFPDLDKILNEQPTKAGK